ncbi:Serologically defined colon cancer antigen 8 [Tupaia chinensis]|uniref:Serologically defined colon cancer antigen 8 n=1 Tax=Tupaia chinensis TaxID=246437 RepID=L9JGN9_TUPCH|nr:Serologically defined colon cancer antigen 8 [Tupaia chinensis]
MCRWASWAELPHPLASERAGLRLTGQWGPVGDVARRRGQVEAACWVGQALELLAVLAFLPHGPAPFLTLPCANVGHLRLRQLDKHSQASAQQLVQLLSKQNQLLLERQSLSEEVDRLRAQRCEPWMCARKGAGVHAGSESCCGPGAHSARFTVEVALGRGQDAAVPRAGSLEEGSLELPLKDVCGSNWPFHLPESETIAMGNTRKVLEIFLYTYFCFSVIPPYQLTEVWDESKGIAKRSKENTLGDTNGVLEGTSA